MTVTDICNVALGYLNQPALNSVNDTGRPEADLCRRLYPVLRDRLLGERAWSFATRVAPLARLAGETSPYPHLSDVCGLPVGCLRVVSVDSREYIRESGKLYTDDGATEVVYVKRIEDTGDYPARFTAALCYLLASELSMPLSNNISLFNMLHQLYEQEINLAASEDAVENYDAHQNERRPGSWVARHWEGA